MQDRVSTYPNRWRLTAVTGETDIYDLTREDDPIVAGTPLNKATFLPDATAAAIAALSGNTPSLPSEALDELVSILTDIGITGIAHVETGSYVGTGLGGASHPTELTFTGEPRFVVVTSGSKAIGEGNDASAYTMWAYGNTYMRSNCNATLNGNTLSWYNTSSSAGYQMNAAVTYNYFAITVN